MKNILLTLVSILYCLSCIAKGNTRISVNMPQIDTIALQVTIGITDPMLNLGLQYYADTALINNGKCQFSFDIKYPSFMCLRINNKYATMPGDYYVLIEPNDNITFDIPSIKEADFFGWGIMKVNISGKGSKKINLYKKAMGRCLKLYAKDPDYAKQSISYMYESTDKKLSVINSTLKEDKTVHINIKNIIKAQIYGSVMTALMRSSKRSESDSLRFLFDKYIIRKKRMDVFYKKDVVRYGGTIGSYLILSEFKNPATVGADDFEKKNRIQYAEILVKRLKNYPEIRDYLLSRHLISSIRSGFDSTTVKLYGYYCNESDFNNPNYNTVVELYNDMERKLSVGKPFYNFSLPDSMGKFHNLTEFKGKVLVIDFWYNGCGGCKLMVPVLEQIENEIKGQNIQFISIGIDNRELWLEGIGKYSSSNSLQLYTNAKSKEHPMMKYLNIYAYPRLIVVDKEGNIVAVPPEPRLRKNAFIAFINNLL
ncbi:redoxin family protein [Chryseobacterium sp. CKR4-1]|uniref:redoxin family protein n=1 Tax=Chryseobacterium sp. CKR4-1 TaxID=3068896 RepID=UPI0027968692|nr:redoxin family protein [Chryseobacterium sp. CKR4-1]MDQ1805026.1 redoxin family protein [Chryseobacterium sp. CKR4-1]